MTRVILARHWKRKGPRLPKAIAKRVAKAKAAKKVRVARKGERG